MNAEGSRREGRHRVSALPIAAVERSSVTRERIRLTCLCTLELRLDQAECHPCRDLRDQSGGSARRTALHQSRCSGPIWSVE